MSRLGFATAAALVAAVFALRCRPLASLAATGLVASATALVTFSRIPFTQNGLSRVEGYLLTVIVSAGMLIWLTIGWALVFTGRLVIKRSQALAAAPDQPDGQPVHATGTLARWAARGAGAATIGLIVLAGVPGVLRPIRSFPEDSQHARLVTGAYRRIHRALPSQPITLTVLAGRPAQQYLLQAGLAWALTGAGYQVQAPRVRAAQRRT